MLVDVLIGTSELTGPAWFVTSATLLTIVFIVAIGVAGFGCPRLSAGSGQKSEAGSPENNPWVSLAELSR